jgi:hypothetical protein
MITVYLTEDKFNDIGVPYASTMQSKGISRIVLKMWSYKATIVI